MCKPNSPVAVTDPLQSGECPQFVIVIVHFVSEATWHRHLLESSSLFFFLLFSSPWSWSRSGSSGWAGLLFFYNIFSISFFIFSLCLQNFRAPSLSATRQAVYVYRSWLQQPAWKPPPPPPHQRPFKRPQLYIVGNTLWFDPTSTHDCPIQINIIATTLHQGFKKIFVPVHYRLRNEN